MKVEHGVGIDLCRRDRHCGDPDRLCVNDKQTATHRSHTLTCLRKCLDFRQGRAVTTSTLRCANFTFKIIYHLLSLLLINDQRQTLGVLPFSELESRVHVQRQGPYRRYRQQHQDCDKEAPDYNLYAFIHFCPRGFHCAVVMIDAR